MGHVAGICSLWLDMNFLVEVRVLKNFSFKSRSECSTVFVSVSCDFVLENVKCVELSAVSFSFWALFTISLFAFSALTLLIGWQEGHLACKNEQWDAGMVICLERGADLHMAQLMPLPLTVSCFSKIQIGSTFLVPAHPSSPGQRAVKPVRLLFLCFCSGWLKCWEKSVNISDGE